MDKFRVLEIKKSIFEDNDHEADLLREDLKKEVIFTNGIFKTECTFIKGIIYTGIRDDDPVRKTDGWRKTSAGT